MKAYKVELLIIDFDELGGEGISDALVNARFPNDCVNLSVKSVTGVDVGNWNDAHPLNQRATADAEYKRLFPP